MEFEESLRILSSVYDQAKEVRLSVEEIATIPPEKRAEALRQKKLKAVSGI